MAKTFITPRVLTPKVVVPKKKSTSKIIQRKAQKKIPLSIKKVKPSNVGNGPKKPIKVVQKPVKVAKTDQKGQKADKKEVKKGIAKGDKPLKADQSGQKKSSSDQKMEEQKLNDCCMFCNNRLVLEAVKSNNIAQLKHLLSDYENITNPFQPYSFSNTEETAIKYAAKSKEMTQIFLKEIKAKKQRKRLESTLLQKFDRGNQGLYNFRGHIRELNQARGSKEGNDAFTYDNNLRLKQRERKLIKSGLYPLEFLKAFIEENKENEKQKQRYQWVQDSLVDYVRNGMIQEAKYLAQFDFSNEITDFNKLYVAALSGELPDRILRISVSKMSYHHRQLSPLHCACINPNPAILKSFLKVCPTFSLPDKNRRNLIHYAAANSNPDVLKFLLSNGCDANELDSQRMTPLMVASQLGRLGNVEALLDKFNKKAKEEKSDSEMSDGEDEDENDAGFDVDYINFKDRSSRTALQYAAYNGHLKIVEALVDAGAEVNTKNSKQITPVLNAAQRGHLDVLKFLHANGADLLGKVNKQRKSALILASANGHYHIVDYLLSSKLSAVTEADTSGNTALHYAVAYGWPNIVKRLLLEGADCNKQNLWNTTPASLAIQKCHYKILDLILNFKQGDGGLNKDAVGGGQTFLSDAQGRDLVSQHLLQFDKNTVDHFETLRKLFKRLKMQHHDSSDINGLNAFHYLCAFSPAKVAAEIAEQQDSDEEDEDGEKSDNDDYDDGQDYYDEDDYPKKKKHAKKSKKGNKDEEMKDEEDKELSKEDRKKLAKYQEISKQIIEIAKTLEDWGYNFDTVASDGHTPFTLAIQCQNVPMINWLLQKNPKIRGVVIEENKRNFLHLVMPLLFDFEMKGDQLDVTGLFEKIYKVYCHSDDLFILAQAQDVRGFTPLHYALSHVLVKQFKDRLDSQQQTSYSNKIVSIVSFLSKIGHKFEETIPQERQYFPDYHLPYNQQQEIRCETQSSSRNSCFQEVIYGGKKQEDHNIFHDFGIIDLKFPVYHSTNFFVGYNWLHFLSQIIVLFNKSSEPKQIINLITNFGKQGTQQSNFAKALIKQQILAQTQYMESPVTMSFQHEPLFRVYLNYLDGKDLAQNLNGLFRDGTPSLIHLTSYLWQQDSVNQLFAIIEKQKSLLTQKDSSGNTLLHYAAHYRNSNMVEMILAKYGAQLFKEDPIQANNLGNSPLHLAVVTRQKNQLQLPKIEEMLINRVKSGMLLHLNQDKENPLMLALKCASNSESDPVNVVKLMLDSSEGGKLIEARDKLGNTPLHIGSQLANIPLALSIVFSKTPIQLRNSVNDLGNTPLSEALINDQMGNALFILQSCNDPKMIQETVNQYESYADIFTNKHVSLIYQTLQGIVTQRMLDERDESVDNYHIKSRDNIHKLALKSNFFGLYHFSDANKSALPILIGALQAKNFVLFNQLLDNYSSQIISSQNPKDGSTLLHALAAAVVKVEDLEEEKIKIDEDCNDYGDEEEEEEQEQEEDEDEDMNDAGRNGGNEATLMKEIYYKLTQTYKIKLDTQDHGGYTPMHIAAKAKNLAFLILAFKDLEKVDKPKALNLINIKDKVIEANFLAYILKSSQQVSESLQLKVLQLLKKKLGNDITKVNMTYALRFEEIDIEARLNGAFYQKTLRQELFPKRQNNLFNTYLNLQFDLVQQQKKKTIAMLIKLGFNFNTQDNNTNTTPLLWACYQRDLATIKVLVEQGKVTIAKNQQDLVLDVLRKPSMLKNYWSYSTEIEKYLFDKKLLTGKKAENPFDYINQKPVINNLFPKKVKNNIDEEFQNTLKTIQGMSKVPANKPQLIDALSEMQKSHEIFIMPQLKPLEMCVLLMKADIKGGYHGTMRYYIMQLLREKKTGYLTLWTRWGRLGERGQNQKTPFRDDQAGALKEFKKLLKQKSGLIWDNLCENPNEKPAHISGKYRIIQLGNRDADKRIMSSYESLTRVININHIIRALEQDLLSENNSNLFEINQFIKNSVLEVVKKYFEQEQRERGWNRVDDKRIMNMALTSDQIAEAYDVLLKLQKLAKDVKEAKKDQEHQKQLNEQMLDLNNSYYCLIPTKDFSYSSASELTEQYRINQELENLKEIYDFSRAFKICMSSIIQKNPLSYVQDQLPIKLKRLSDDQGNQEFSMIMKYINASLINDETQKNEFCVKNIFALSDSELYKDQSDNNVFNELHNHWMLWHGTKNENLMSILLKGLKIKPPNAHETGSLFGKAIYFSDKFSKSLNYSSKHYKKSKKQDNSFYMILCEVALGNIANYASDWSSEIYRPPFNQHSIRIMSSEGPDFAHNVINDQHQIYPSGPLVKYPKAQLEKGVKLYKTPQNFFAEYLKKKKEIDALENKKKKGGKKKQEENEQEDQEDLDIDEEEVVPEEELRKLEESFLKVKERQYEVKPNVINADYCLKRLTRDHENFSIDDVYGSDSEYMVYSEKQVRIRYLVQLQMI